MRLPRHLLLLLNLLIASLLLSSCATPPSPPGVDATARRPANNREAVELQGCRHELHNTRIRATESGRLAETANGALQRFARQQAQATTASASASAATGNAIFSVRFAFARSEVMLSSEATQALLAVARSAPLIVLHGRTDGRTDSTSESRIARERALAVKAFLIQAGIDAGRIRATYQPIGDPVADNGTAAGRDLNRRVEVEVYRTLPVAIGATDASRG